MMFKLGIVLLLFSIGLYPMATEAGEIASGAMLFFGVALGLAGAIADWIRDDE